MYEESGKGTGIWTERIDDVTGKSSLQSHTPKIIWKSCKQGLCSYKITSNRELECSKCGFIVNFTPGRDNELLKKHGIIK